jgi:glycosyltransferase 2 family protein
VKKLLITLLKVAISLAIIGYLVYDATRAKEGGNVFANLVEEPKHWNLLATAWACCTVAVLLTFVRWWYLVRALDVPCRFPDALRISFWGYLFNLAPLGIVGGDLVKAVMLGHEHPQHRAKGVASVLIDRVLGLYLLFVVASTAILLTGFWRIDAADIFQTRWFNFGIYEICLLTFGLTIAGTVGLAVLLGPDATDGGLARVVGRIPRVGRPLESLIVALRMYRNKPGVLLLASLMSVGVHCFFAAGCYFIACGLPGNHLSLAKHFVVMPLSAATQVIPLPLGPFEAVLDCLYTHVPVAGAPIAVGQGLVVALVYRLITLLIAALGMFYYLGNRREMAEVIHEAEHEGT